jgi:ATP-binding protein involved in chromosome partitioning
MNVAVKAIGMFHKLNVPIVGVIENMSYLQCPHCGERTHIFGKGGGQRVSEKFNVPFIGEIPLHLQIMTGSDTGEPITLSEPGSVQANVFTNVAKTVAGRISVIAAEMKAADEAEAAGQPGNEKDQTEHQNVAQS